ncbi:hypothetical protein K490DRAFT_49863 [Saccharata proteae CBS 121410]|uniref:RING-type E3 ubiquitin transferase n=1 Tax=Saccharata proteae CBS 121410 TaxID=1314787 RepID=A0A9P4HR81_9PEZI|nr:hypothetical protein K490DRAFT_49863 [Saccharata proteae CBS 121410]
MTSTRHFPFAASPDIIRSNQKDLYFQSELLTQLTALLRKLYGARLAHAYAAEARTAADLLYHALTTLLGNRTLGEEYCDIVHVEHDTLRLPSLARRAGYILSTILLPYGIGRIMPAFRRRVRAKLEANLRRSSRATRANAKKQSSALYKFHTYILANIDTITSPAPLYAVSLAVFYFSGAYYQLGKRAWGLRYIFTRRIEPGEQRVGYEVLGVLLVLQMAVQGWLHVQRTLATEATAAAAAARGDGQTQDQASSNTTLLFDPTSTHPTPSREKLQRMTATPTLARPRHDLADPQTMPWIPGRQQRKCTLCLEEMKDPSVTTCGHVFCWTCIGDWVREKPECPLCRGVVLVQKVLPLRC